LADFDESGTWGTAWRSFATEHRSRLERFRREMASAWKDLAVGLKACREAVGPSYDRIPEADRIGSLRHAFDEVGGAVLVEPLRSLLRTRPEQRALAGLTELETALNDLLRGLPTDISTSVSELAQVLGDGVDERWLRWQARFRLGAKQVPLRQLVAEQIQAETMRRSLLDGEFQLLLARATLHLLGPWQAYRQCALDWLEYPAGEAAKPANPGEHWQRQSEQYSKRAEALLERYARWSREAPANVASELLRRAAPRPPGEVAREGVELTEHLRYWSRQQRAVQHVLDLELRLVNTLKEAIVRLERAASSVDAEHEDLAGELETVTLWLEEHRESGVAAEFPAAQARLQSAEARLDDCVREMAALARERLPATIEAIAPKRALPGWRKPWRNLEPQGAFEHAVNGTARRTAMEGFRDAESAHRAIVREIERAREVVSFAHEASAEEGGEGAALAAEGIANAIELLKYQARSAAPVRSAVEAGLTRGLAAAALECYITLDQGRLGALRHLAIEASQHGTRRLLHVGVAGARHAALELGRLFGKLFNWMLYRLGLKTPPAPPAPAVHRTRRLEEVLEFQLVRFEPPALYRRLFRLDPVEDPRFLVGREEEMSGLVEARCLWLTGRPVSILLVGARGSGKTSLLNCAIETAFAGVAVVRSQFRERLVEAAEMEQFLRKLLEVPAEKSLREHLAAEQRVIILEEAERTFLRSMGGFGAFRYLAELIAATWQSTLWVLSLNEGAAGYLDRAVGLRGYFSHRVNAMAVQLDDLRNAILMRHNLSGYRLLFEPPPIRDPRISRLRRRLGLERDAEELFFEALYEHSEGVFRSAFELWQRHIDRIEGGVVHLRQPTESRFSEFISQLTADDHFTLHAILQHGGLSIENLAEVFSEPVERSRSRMERLIALELLEPDPVAPGYRVRPEGGRVVREALHRQNL